MNGDPFNPRLQTETPARIEIPQHGDIQVEIFANERNEVFTFHNKAFEGGLKRLELHRLARKLYFVLSAGPALYFGIRIVEPIYRHMERADRVLMVLMDEKTGEPVGGDYYPLLHY